TDDSPAGKMFATVLSAMAQLDNDVRSERALRGMKSRLESGRWVWTPPVGYMPGPKSGPSLVPDPARAHHVAKLFNLVATGNTTKADALTRVNRDGLRTRRGAMLTGETLRRVLTNPVYCGQILVAKWGKALKGDWEPIISESVFNQVQAILEGRAPVAVAHAKDREDFALRGSVICEICKKPVTASWSSGKAKVKFPYYRCH